MVLELQRETTEYVYVGITGDVPSGDVELALLDGGDRPEEEDWRQAIKIDSDEDDLWEAAQASDADGDWFAALLIGTYQDGGADLSPGDYQLWVRFTDDDERPVRIAPTTLVIE